MFACLFGSVLIASLASSALPCDDGEQPTAARPSHSSGSDGHSSGLKEAASTCASSRPEVRMQSLAECQLIRATLAEKALLAPPGGRLWAVGSHRSIACRRRSAHLQLIHPQLHSSLKDSRVPSLQLNADSDERIGEEGLCRDLFAASCEDGKEPSRRGTDTPITLDCKGNEDHAALLAYGRASASPLQPRSSQAHGVAESERLDGAVERVTVTSMRNCFAPSTMSRSVAEIRTDPNPGWFVSTLAPTERAS
jgi:hypothetical protein